MKSDRSSRIFALLVFLSGIAGLSYELIWIRSIKGYFGCEIFSITMVITIFFAGMGLGGIIGSRYLKKGVSPLRIYMIIETLIALFGLFFPFLIQLVQKSYLTMTVFSSADYWIYLKAIHIILLLIIPTTLIGITLPLIASIVVYKPEVFTSRFSLYYGLNTFGAVVGSLLCGLVLIPHIGLSWTGRIIALVNISVVGLCWYSQNKFSINSSDVIFKPQKWNQALLPSLIAFFMGFLALSYEIVWIRIFNFNFLTTTISLAILLSLFLIGLTIGSILLSFWKRQVSVFQLGFLEFIKALLIVVSFFLIRKIFYQDWIEILSGVEMKNDIFELIKFYIIFGSLAFLIPGILMGMTFPLIEKIWPSANAGTGHVVGIVTAWNTWGGAIGSMLAGLFLISFIGSTNTLIVTLVISCTISIAIFVIAKKYYFTAIPLVLALAVILLLPREMNWKRTVENLPNYKYYKEGKVGSVSVLKNRFGDLTLNIDNSYVLGGTSLKAARVQEHQGALPIILEPSKDKKVLKIGEGTGITSLYAVNNTGTKQLDIVEIVPEVIEALPYFSYYNENIVQNPSVKYYKGDGREFMALSKEKYDVIIGELYSPQMAGTGNLYSVEHFQNIKNHLADKGVFCQWIIMSHFTPEMFQIVVRTFLDVFKNGSLWLVNSNYAMPSVGLVYRDNEFWDINSINAGLDQYSDSFKTSMGWKTPSDIAVSIVTDNLWDLTSDEQRINSITHPYVEEIAARTVLYKQPSPLNWLVDKRHWPESWSQLKDEQYAWNKLWELMTSMIKFMENRQVDDSYINVMSMLNTFPSTPILNIYKADVMHDITENIFFKQQIFEDEKSQNSFIAEFYGKTIELDPYNFRYRSNMLYIYQLLGDNKKRKAEFQILWNMLPAHLKEEEIYRDLKNSIQ